MIKATVEYDWSTPDGVIFGEPYVTTKNETVYSDRPVSEQELCNAVARVFSPNGWNFRVVSVESVSGIPIAEKESAVTVVDSFPFGQRLAPRGLNDV